MKKIVLNEQNFAVLRQDNGVYVDKTRQIYNIIDFSRYVFLSRPRRFGKSLLVSTLEALFSGKKELFKGLWIENNWEWEEYPIIRLDFSKLLTGRNIEILDQSLIKSLRKNAKKYGIELDDTLPSLYLDSLIDELYEQTGKRVVLLIDEYDNPITSHLSDIKVAKNNREYFRDIYQIIKAHSAIHFVFMTGVSKFAKMALFSAISQLKDISLLSKFNDIVGFTEEELVSNFSEHIELFRRVRNMTREEAMNYIRKWYDGYSWNAKQHLYNPYAILNALSDQRLKPYWFETGTPTFLIQLATRDKAFKIINNSFSRELDEIIATEDDFESYNLENINIIGALFQSGYLTVKRTEEDGHLKNYYLGFPNFEVRHAFNAHLLKVLLQDDVANVIKSHALLMRQVLKKQDRDQFQELITAIFAGIPSDNLKKLNEFGYQALFYQLLLLLGINDIFLEVAGYIGRADGVLLLENNVFVFEFKFARQGTMKYLLDKASDQAKLKGYWHPYLGTDKAIFRVAVGFLYKKVKDGKEEKEVLTIDSNWKRIIKEEDF